MERPSVLLSKHPLRAIPLLLALATLGCEEFLTKNIVFGGRAVTTTTANSGDSSDNSSDVGPTDDDNDGLSNEVENSFLIGPLTADSDGDGFNDGLEFVGPRGDPLDSSRIPIPIAAERILTAADIRTNLLDGDEDGISDSFESANGLDPEDPDSDDDGYTDALELVAGSDPLQSSSRPSRASAPVSNGASAPTSPDSDRDGLSDAIERDEGTTPELRDSDKDGFSDGIEYISGSDPLDAASVPAF